MTTIPREPPSEALVPTFASLPAVPGPKPLPLIGNVLLFARPDAFYEVCAGLFEQHGPMVHLSFPGAVMHICCDPDVVGELVSRPDDFPKLVKGDRSPLGHLHAYAVGNGLFTADDADPTWGVAHRVLLPALGAHALKQYFPRMLEVADETIAYLGGLPPDAGVLMTDVMTRMTFETIAYAGFDTRFHCLTGGALPAFVQAMVDILLDAQEAPNNLLPPFFHPIASYRRHRAAAVLRDTVDTIIAERRVTLGRGDPVPNDMLQAMLASRDRVTGGRLDDANIRHQLNTFLIAGHETTSGLLSYALHYLATHPAVEAQVVAEVDRVLGRDFSRPPTMADIEKLDLVGRVLKETLRLNPTAPAFMRTVMQDTVVGGRFPVTKGARILVLLKQLQRDPNVFGQDADDFKPDRFLPGADAGRHPHAYHPFGIGMRSCIGFQFALIEARLMLARLYQRFLPRQVDPAYVLRDVPTLTVKPADLVMRLDRRPEDRSVRAAAALEIGSHVGRVAPSAAAGVKLLVLYGSNMGASQDLALAVARDGERRGINATVAELDAFAGRLPERGTLVIVTSTYNGAPPDNAVRFAEWLQEAPSAPLDGLHFAVLGCGNTQWRGTYQRFPIQVHDGLVARGATPLVPSGACDADGDFEAAADAFLETLWPALTAHLGATPGDAVVEEVGALVTVEPVEGAGADVWPEHPAARLGTVRVNRELQSAGSGRSTRHLEIVLPDGVTYAAGDHLGVFPENRPRAVAAMALRVGVEPTAQVVVRSTQDVRLPLGVPVTVSTLLGRFVDLEGPVTRRELRLLAARCPCPPERDALLAMTTDDGFRTAVLEGRPTLLELLERYRAIECDLALLLSLRPPLKPRYYSIASSPRVLPRACALTVGVHEFVSPSGRRHEGVGSHYVAGLAAGAPVRFEVKDTGSTFRLPTDPATDVLLIGPGTGLAPFRGFIQERAALRANNTVVGRTVLYFGCRGASQDFLYREELEAWVADGTLSGLHVALSREPGQPRRYVQDLLRAQAAEVTALVAGGAVVYVCGDARSMAPGVLAALEAILGSSDAVERLKTEGRYVQDVWAS